MPPLTSACPKCATPFTVTQPAPERITCSKCGANIRITFPAPASKPAPPSVSSQAKVGVAKLVANYELQRELARGGLGVVFLAFHPRLKHYRAIKRPQARPDLDSEVLMARFVRETEALGALDSKHIIRAYDAGADTDGPYLVMEYLDGESLSSLVSRHRQLPVSEACELIRQAALGLQAAHECGLVHRDIKPSNLMLARAAAGTARVTVIDWGLVKRADEPDMPANRLTKIHAELGTPDYISPEQARDASSVDIRADIYSLGATLFFLLAGQPPFHGRSDEQKLLAQAREEFPPLEHLRPDVPQNVINVMKKMVKKERSQRYATPGEAATALQPFACAEPHRMLALLAPVSRESVAPLDTRRMLDEKTQLAPPPCAPVPSPNTTPPPSNRTFIWFVAGTSAFLVLASCILGSAIGVGLLLNNKDDGKRDDSVAKGNPLKANGDASTADQKKIIVPDGPLLFEDFRATLVIGEPRPKGWEGNAYRVGSFKGEPCLELSMFAGEPKWVTLPALRTTLKGNFFIEGHYSMDPGWHAEAMALRLESSKSSDFLLVGISESGVVSFGPTETFKPRAEFKVGVQFLLTRDGRNLTVRLNGAPVADKIVNQVTEFDSIKIGFTPHQSNSPRLYKLKIDDRLPERKTSG